MKFSELPLLSTFRFIDYSLYHNKKAIYTKVGWTSYHRVGVGNLQIEGDPEVSVFEEESDEV